MIKPFSQACENNSAPILHQLTRLFEDTKTVLEVGSGTGQHAAYFAEGIPHLTWQTSDLTENHEGIHLWVEESGRQNLFPPIEFDVNEPPLSHGCSYDAVFMANTLHIMPCMAVENCIRNLAQYINTGGLLVVYGPFNYEGEFTSDSNARFDQWLKAADPQRGIRDFEWINKLAEAVGFSLLEDNSMPANNRLLVWCFKPK